MAVRPLRQDWQDSRRSDATLPQFSLVRGGIIYRLERHLGLIDEKKLGIRKRILLSWCVTWLPILILELARMASAGTPRIPHPLLTSGLGINTRLLFSSAVLIAAEQLVETRINSVISQFIRRGIVENPDELTAILAESHRKIAGAPGIKADAMMLVLAFFVTILGYRSHWVGPLQDWKLLVPEGNPPAGLTWYLLVALPLLFYLVLRWGWRFIAWTRVLWKIAKIKLQLNTSHPDMAGGLAFVVLAQEAFASVCLAISASASATVGFRSVVLKMPLQSFYPAIGSLVAVETLVLLAPLTFFFRRLMIAKREGLVHYGALASDYVNEFDRKWIQGNRRDDEPLLGSPDLEQWGSVGIGLERSGKMRPFPASPSAILVILSAATIPFLPLAFFVFPVNQVLRAVAKLLF